MHLWKFTPELANRRDKLVRKGYMVFCLFCKTGREITLAEELNRTYPDYLALPFVRAMHRSRLGVRFLEQDILLAGYIFLYLPESNEDSIMLAAKTGFRILGDIDGLKALKGANRDYAAWVLSYGGIIGVSKALRVGSRVKIVDGPLLHIEGYIAEYSKKNRNCRVQIDVEGKELKAWLPFEWVEAKDEIVGVYRG